MDDDEKYALELWKEEQSKFSNDSLRLAKAAHYPSRACFLAAHTYENNHDSDVKRSTSNTTSAGTKRNRPTNNTSNTSNRVNASARTKLSAYKRRNHSNSKTSTNSDNANTTYAASNFTNRRRLSKYPAAKKQYNKKENRNSNAIKATSSTSSLPTKSSTKSSTISSTIPSTAKPNMKSTMPEYKNSYDYNMNFYDNDPEFSSTYSYTSDNEFNINTNYNSNNESNVNNAYSNNALNVNSNYNSNNELNVNSNSNTSNTEQSVNSNSNSNTNNSKKEESSTVIDLTNESFEEEEDDEARVIQRSTDEMITSADDVNHFSMYTSSSSSSSSSSSEAQQRRNLQLQRKQQQERKLQAERLRQQQRKLQAERQRQQERRRSDLLAKKAAKRLKREQIEADERYARQLQMQMDRSNAAAIHNMDMHRMHPRTHSHSHAHSFSHSHSHSRPHHSFHNSWSSTVAPISPTAERARHFHHRPPSNFDSILSHLLLPQFMQQHMPDEEDDYESNIALTERLGKVVVNVPKSVIDSFPEVAYSDQEADTQCMICLEEYKVGDKVKKLPCLHLFHPTCISRWLSEHVNCPICNTDVRN